MKFIIKLLLFLLAAILAGLLVAQPAIAEAPLQSNSEDYISENLVIKDDAIQPTIPTLEPNTSLVEVRRNNPTGIQAGSSYAGRTYSKEEVIQLIKDYSVQYGISPNLPLAIARCESGYNQFSKNKNSTASGVFQWLSSSWTNQPPGKAGVSVFEANANIQAAVWLIANGKTSPWNASINCWQ